MSYNILSFKEIINTYFILDFQPCKFFFKLFLHVRFSLDWIFRESFISTIKQLKEIAKYLGAVASVNLFNNQIFIHRLFTLLHGTIFLPRLNISLHESLAHKLVDDFIFRHFLAILAFNRNCFSSDNCHYRHRLGGRLVCAYKSRVIRIGMERCTNYILASCQFIYCMTFTSTRGTIEDLLESFLVTKVKTFLRNRKRLPFRRFKKQVKAILICQPLSNRTNQATRSINCICNIKNRRISKII